MENCPRCGHVDHGVRACAACLETGTCWQPILITGGDGDSIGKGEIEMVTGLETKPCLLCKSWDKNLDQIIQHFLAHGLRLRPDGQMETPIKDDFKTRKVGMVINPRDYGFCRRDTMPTDMLASCENWVPTKRLVDFQRRRMG